MAEPDIKCDACGRKLEGAHMFTEMALMKPNEKRIEPRRHQRVFKGNCPEHGPQIVAFPGEGHSTILESGLKKRFKKQERKLLLGSLQCQERRDFQDALRGQYRWDEGDVSWWKRLLRALGRK